MTDVDVRTTRVPMSTCPGCRAPLDAVSGTGVPAAGDVSMCAYCRLYVIFSDDLSVRLLTNAEWLALPIDQRTLLTELREWFKAKPDASDRTAVSRGTPDDTVGPVGVSDPVAP